ncbi:MAG TPA: prepilin-type N-terminal cleavage/methylation domain-containing protein [Candidatus Acidoferrales bacterium]|nr:prepilin-type N-terminal cleavage/methylation domain-containing protein [Candidatus Acidoferrales bacterium]
MKTVRIARKRNQLGFTLIETMVALAVFVVICGAVFKLLNTSQQRYHTESQVLDTLQDSRLGMDQLVRDAGDAGYPPFMNFSNLPAGCNAASPCASYANSPLAWSPGYVTQTPCQIGTAGGGTCITPGDFDVIFEEQPDNNPNVQFIRYTLQGTTLFRGTARKLNNNSALATLSIANNNMYPYIYNVVNNDTAANIATYRAAYPTMFPGGNPVPIFQFYCLTAGPAGPVAPAIPCTNPAASNSPKSVVDVEITLIVNTPQRDMQNNSLHLVELNGRGHVINPL